MMVTSARAVPGSSALDDDQLRRPLRLAVAGLAVFVAGAAMTMTMAGLFNPLLLALAALINLVLMLPICGVTALLLDWGGRHPADGPTRQTRIARRTLNLASLYWTAAGLAFLLSPFLARL